jgi:hypothetical protein
VRNCIGCLPAVVLLAVPAPCHAWNGIGHMSVAKIAYDDLDKETRGRITKLLLQHPHYGKYLKANKPDGVELEERRSPSHRDHLSTGRATGTEPHN